MTSLVPFTKLTKLQEAYVSMLARLGSPTHAVTITFKRYQLGTNKAWSKPIIKDALKVCLSILNDRAFSGIKPKRNRRVMSAVVVGTGAYKDHPHAHLALGCPPHLSYEEFENIVNKAASKTWWIGQKPHHEPYESKGWLTYMVEHGEEDLVLELCTPAQP